MPTKIPVGLFALQMQLNEINEYLLQVLWKTGRGIALPNLVVGQAV